MDRKRNKNHLVTKDNALINASYRLSLVEQRLVLLAIVLARETGHGIDPSSHVTISAASYEQRFDVERHSAYEALATACKALMEQMLRYTDINESGKTELVESRWVSECRYVPDMAVVRVTFAPLVAQMITRLERHFTTYELEQIQGLSTPYAIRLYELLASWRSSLKTPMYRLAELREKLGVKPDEYQRISNFKARVLFPALEQINKKTDIEAEYDQERNGKEVAAIGFKFKLKSNEAGVDTASKPDGVSEDFVPMTLKQITFFGAKLAADPAFGSVHALPGEEEPDFAARIMRLLKNVEKQKQWLADLQRVGYKADKNHK